MRKYHMITGLPRSGSTLISSILNQNPRFTTGISDPLLLYLKGMLNVNNHMIGAEALVPPAKVKTILRGIADLYYEDGNEVCFNTNREWTSDTSLAKQVFPEFKMIVCVRDVPWILDSFEKLNNANPFSTKAIYNFLSLQTVYERAKMLMGQHEDEPGYVMYPLKNLMHAAYCAERDRLLFVEYDALVSKPEQVTRKIYEFIEEPYYEHDFDNVGRTYKEYDTPLRMEGLHDVRNVISKDERRTVLPNEIWSEYEKYSFWKFDHGLKKNLNWIGL